ncbi:unnamed protein product [Peronospora belbahrii]|uniref:Secreted protein n=1 Tax=Peronospora belbahrii TaxID=622444 RepID=A0AAU9L0R3_9STRA|nr:unnamed protein product [Peronospora belbahrii]
MGLMRFFGRLGYGLYCCIVAGIDRCRNGEVRENRQFFLVTRKVFGDKSFTLSLLETVISTHRYIHTDLSCLRLR